MNKPIIGISLDSEKSGGYSLSPWYAIRQNYCQVISDNGGIPVGLPHDVNDIEEYLNILDGIIITGGGFDIPPSYYNEEISSDKVKTKEDRTEFEYNLAKLAVEKNKPILGICGGQQLLTVILGGSLIQHIPDEIENCLEHQQKPPYNKAAHNVKIIKDTLLHKIIGKDEIGVNTDHHQATKKVPDDIIISAIAPDGVIEAIEYNKHPFCLGVVWHPEHMVSESDQKIIKYFINKAGELKK